VVAANAVGGNEEGSGEESPPIEERGVVNGRQVPNPDGSGTTVCQPPIAGAVVSSSLDSATTTTGADERFRLVTQTPGSIPCQVFTVTITASGWPTYTGTATFRQPHESRWAVLLLHGPAGHDAFRQLPVTVGDRLSHRLALIVCLAAAA
jgi:hypothetical protein